MLVTVSPLVIEIAVRRPFPGSGGPHSDGLLARTGKNDPIDFGVSSSSGASSEMSCTRPEVSVTGPQPISVVNSMETIAADPNFHSESCVMLGISEKSSGKEYFRTRPSCVPTHKSQLPSSNKVVATEFSKARMEPCNSNCVAFFSCRQIRTALDACPSATRVPCKAIEIKPVVVVCCCFGKDLFLRGSLSFVPPSSSSHSIRTRTRLPQSHR